MRSRALPRATWPVVAGVVAWALVAAATSPLLEWRGAVYIAAGLAGVLALALLLVQPLLATGRLPGLEGPRGRRVHRWMGGALVAMVVAHVAGLWVTSPPDVIDVLLFRSPTPFSVWGAIALWAVLAAALLAVLRRRLAPSRWRLAHTGLVVVATTATVLHAVQIEGTMGTASKAVLCALALAATLWAAKEPWLRLVRRRA